MKNKFKIINIMKLLWSYIHHLLIVLVPVLLIINLGFVYIVSIEKQNIISQQESIANEHNSVIDFVIRTAITDTYNDMQVIKDSNEFSSYANTPTPETLEGLQQLMFRIATNKSEFNNIKLLDLLGNEIIRVNNEDGNIVIVDEEDLVTKADTYYFGEAFVLEDDQLYISSLDLEVEDGNIVVPYQPVLRFAIPAYNADDEKIGFIFLNYDANKFLSVFNEYVDHSETVMDLGIYSGNSIYRFDSTDSEGDYVLNIFTDVSDQSELLDPKKVSLTPITIDEDILDIMIGSDDFLMIYTYLDRDAVSTNNLSPLTRTPAFVIIVNILICSLFLYLGYMLKTKQESKTLLNASTYLSDNNKDGVIITNQNRDIIYINKSFSSVFGYELSEIENNQVDSIMRVDIYKKTLPLLKSKEILWNRTKSNIYIYTSFQEEQISMKHDVVGHYIQIYSNPTLTFNKLFETMSITETHYRNAYFDNMAELFSFKKVIPEKTSMILIMIGSNESGAENIQNLNQPFRKCQLAEYLRTHLDDNYMISIPLKNFILLEFDADLKHRNISEYIGHIHELINEYKYRLVFNKETNYLITADTAKNEEDTYSSMMFNVFAAMRYLINSRNLRTSVYMPKMRNTVVLGHHMRLELDNAFEKDEFYMNYQVLQNVQTGEIVGAEALLRWHNPRLGYVSPNDFIPIIEDSYHINQLSKMVIQKVIHDFEPYANQLPENFRLSINLTSYDFQNEIIITDLINTILSSPLDTSHFCFEITESGYLENTLRTRDIINYLHSMNIQIAIDDFGTGFASLSSLKNITADKVKIDRMFIKDYPTLDNGLMHKTIVYLIKNLGFSVVIEGIETQKQLELVKETGCNEFQGFLVSKPISMKSFRNEFLNNILKNS